MSPKSLKKTPSSRHYKTVKFNTPTSDGVYTPFNISNADRKGRHL